MVKVSVIVPSYNSILYYKECIESILRQEEKAIEIIPVDAGSEDGTWELICSYAKSDSRIHPIQSERKSYGYQCNIGIRSAKGKYVAVVESDDYILPHMYGQLYQAAEENRLDWVKADFDFFVDLEKRFFLHYPILPSDKKKDYGKVLNLTYDPEIIFRDLNLWNGIYKREFLEKEKIWFHETDGAAFQDIGFVLQTLLVAKRFMYLPSSSYCYRQDNQMSSIYNPAGVRYVWNEFQYMECFFEKNSNRYDAYKAVILKKLFGDFKGVYVRMPQLKELGKKEWECVNSFRKCFKLQYNHLSICEKLEEKMPLNIYMNLFLDDLEQFDQLVRKEKELTRNVRKTAIQIAKRNQVVIAGAGEWGSGLFAFFKNNGVDSVSAFCDNNLSLLGKEHMGLKIFSVTEISNFRNKALFFISSESYYRDIKKQLLTFGIDSGQIVRSPMIPLHEALEDRLCERSI